MNRKINLLNFENSKKKRQSRCTSKLARLSSSIMFFILISTMIQISNSTNQSIYSKEMQNRHKHTYMRKLNDNKGKPDSLGLKTNYPYKVTEEMLGPEMLTKSDVVDNEMKQAVLQEEVLAEKDRLREIRDKKLADGSSIRYRDWEQPLKNEGEKCNLLLMKAFKLQGRLWSRPKEEMKICPAVKSNCCTYMDELVILKLWNEYSKPHIKDVMNKLVYNYKKILLLHYRISNISIKEIDFHMYKSQSVQYERTICERRDEVAHLDFNGNVKENKKALEFYYKDDNTEDKKFNILDQVVEGSIAKEVKKNTKEDLKKKHAKKKGKKRKLQIEDRLLEEINDYHNWSKESLDDLQKTFNQSKENIKNLRDHVIREKQILQKKQNQKISIDSNDKFEKENKESRNLSLQKKNPETQAQSKNPGVNPMDIMMSGLAKSLQQIEGDKAIKEIIEATEQKKQAFADATMFKSGGRHVDQDLDKARKSVDHERNQTKRSLVLNGFETQGINNINWLKSQFQKSLLEPVKRIHKVFEGKKNRLLKIKSKLQVKLAELNTKLGGLGLNKNKYKEIMKKFPKMSDFNIWVYHQIREGKKNIEDMPEFIVYKEEKVHSFLNKTKKTLEDMLEQETKFLSKQKNVPIDNDFLYKFMKTLNKKDIPKIDLPFYPKRDRVLPKLPNVPLSKIYCFSYPVTFPRKFLIFNPTKFEFCYKSVLKLRKFDAQVFSGYLYSARNAIQQLVSLKKNVYCDVCEQSKQQYFDMENEMIYYKIGFCSSLISDFKEYIKWKNIIFIEYLGEIFNYIQCFETKASTHVFPFKTYVDQQKREIYFVRRCLQYATTPSGFKYCHFICKQFNYMTFDNFFIGNADFLQNIFALLTSFLRKMKIALPKKYYNEIEKGHGQFETTKTIYDPYYAAHMRDPAYDQ